MRIIIMVETGSNDEMKDILKELRKKMNEIDEMTEDLEEKRSELLKTTPKKTARLLEEIKVPALSLLK
jgi:predicted  nucleic acid-binding Zn-ribbon protein